MIYWGNKYTQMRKQPNIFVAFLSFLNVKHTRCFSNQYFNTHPHKYNLFGLSKMLSEYGIANKTFVVDDKERSIIEFETPFIAHKKNKFIIIYKVEDGKIYFWEDGSNNVLIIDKFIQAWTGVVLLAKSSDKSIEPDYSEHLKIKRLNCWKKALFFCSCSIITLFLYLRDELYANAGISLLMLTQLTGIFITSLLLLKQIYLGSEYADKICSLFKQKDCISILETKGAKLMGVLGWSEIGLGYFITNALVILFSPHLIPDIAIVNIITLPFTFWSVWYQSSKIKQWCILCLIVQILLWIMFIINSVSGNIRLPVLEYQELVNLILLGCCYSALMLGISLLVPKLSASMEIQSLEQSLNSIKANTNVFVTLLKEQPFYDFNSNISAIHFGNPNSSLQLTIVSNPYCHHCSIMHKKIERLLQKMNDKIGIYYILSSFDRPSNSTNKYLIAAYLANKNDVARRIFSEWFEGGKEQLDDFFKDLSLDIDNPQVAVEFQKHEFWRKKNHIQAVPSVLLNGYLLPGSYRVEDLQYFTEINI